MYSSTITLIATNSSWQLHHCSAYYDVVIPKKYKSSSSQFHNNMGADKLFVRQIQVLFSVVISVIVAGLSVHEHKPAFTNEQQQTAYVSYL